MKKRILPLVLALLFLSAGLPGVALQPARFNDISDDMVTRADAMLCFADVLGVTVSTDSELKADEPVTREEVFDMAAKAVRLSGGTLSQISWFADYKAVSPQYIGSIGALVSNGYITGTANDNNSLNPKALMTRGELAALFGEMFPTIVTSSGVTSKVNDGNVVVKASGATLSNLTVKGDLIIADSVEYGGVNLENVVIHGRMVVRGDKNSVVISGNSKVNELAVARDGGAVGIKVQDDSIVGLVGIEDGSDDVVIDGNVSRVNIQNSGVPVILRDGYISAVEVKTDGAEVILTADSKVKNLSVEAKNVAVGTADGAQITILTVTETAKNLSVTGGGTILRAEINASNTAIENTPVVTVTGDGVNGTVVVESGELRDAEVVIPYESNDSRGNETGKAPSSNSDIEPPIDTTGLYYSVSGGLLRLNGLPAGDYMVTVTGGKDAGSNDKKHTSGAMVLGSAAGIKNVTIQKINTINGTIGASANLGAPVDVAGFNVNLAHLTDHITLPSFNGLTVKIGTYTIMATPIGNKITLEKSDIESITAMNAGTYDVILNYTSGSAIPTKAGEITVTAFPAGIAAKFTAAKTVTLTSSTGTLENGAAFILTSGANIDYGLKVSDALTSGNSVTMTTNNISTELFADITAYAYYVSSTSVSKPQTVEKWSYESYNWNAAKTYTISESGAATPDHITNKSTHIEIGDGTSAVAYVNPVNTGILSAIQNLKAGDTFSVDASGKLTAVVSNEASGKTVTIDGADCAERLEITGNSRNILVVTGTADASIEIVGGIVDLSASRLNGTVTIRGGTVWLPPTVKSFVLTGVTHGSDDEYEFEATKGADIPVEIGNQDVAVMTLKNDGTVSVGLGAAGTGLHAAYFGRSANFEFYPPVFKVEIEVGNRNQREITEIKVTEAPW